VLEGKIYMKKTRKKTRLATAESIARVGESGNDVSRFFTNAGGMVKPKDASIREKQRKSRFLGQRSPSE
jgi:hypothetical protein